MAEVFHFIMVSLTNILLTSKKDLVFKGSVISLSIPFFSLPRPVRFNIQQCSDSSDFSRAHAACPDSQILVQNAIKAHAITIP